jgi:hypothetical protein
MLKFYYNGIKDNGGKLQKVRYSDGQLINYPSGTITIYKKDYDSFSHGVHAAFTVQNDTDIYTDYIVKDIIRVAPSHPLHRDVSEALAKQQAHRAKRDQRGREVTT